MASYSQNRWNSICGIPGNHGSFGITPEPVRSEIIHPPADPNYLFPWEQNVVITDVMEDKLDVYYEDGCLYMADNGTYQMWKAINQGKFAEFLAKVIGDKKIAGIYDFTGEMSNEDWCRDNRISLLKNEEAMAALRDVALPGSRLYNFTH